MTPLIDLAQRAKNAAGRLAIATRADKDAALHAIADALEAHTDPILAANADDLAAGRDAGLGDHLLDRMRLDGRLAGIAADVRTVADLPDPVGIEYDARTLDNGLRICRRRTPIGVLGVIYEARPNVTVDVIALAIKSGNAAILRGGKEIIGSNRALIEVILTALAPFADCIPADAIGFIASADRALIDQMLRLHTHIDLIIPRGGAALHQRCRENSTIPVITGGLGICHIVVDASADLDAALPIIDNAKTQRPSVCNALDTVLVHSEIAESFLPRVVTALAAKGVRFRAEPRALAVVGGMAGVEPAGDADFDTEWMALILGLKIVDDLDEAIAHIRAHSTQHSDAILTRDPNHSARFIAEVDSSAVFVNASTRFNDGGQLGLGAEIAVSTQKLHARGPMGLEELTTYKWIVRGEGHVRS